MIYRNGHIYTVDEKKPWAQSLAVKDGRFLAVGSDNDVMAMSGPETKTVDLSGKMVMPGIHDAHLHMLDAGLTNTHYCRLSNDIDWETASNLLKDCAKRLEEGQWLIGYTYKPEWFGEQFHTSKLDAVVADHPVLLRRWDWHAVALNSKGLNRVLSQAPKGTFTGPHVELDDKGERTGQMLEDVGLIAHRYTTSPNAEQYEAAMKWAIDRVHRYGITSVQDAGTKREGLEVLKRLDERGELRLNVATHLVWWNQGLGGVDLAELEKLVDEREQYRSAHVDVDYIKLWLDGTPTPPIATDVGLDHHGDPDYEVALIDQDSLNQGVARFDQMGLQVKIHVVGKGAAHMALDAIEAARQANPGSSIVHELGHTVDLVPADRERMKELKVTADVSPYLWQFEPDADSFPMRSLEELDILVTLGSDWPIIPVNPFPPLAATLERSRQGVDVETAIRMMTLNGAKSVGKEDQLGSIAVGKDANFIVLDRNLITASSEEVRGTQVLETVFEGRTVYARP